MVENAKKKGNKELFVVIKSQKMNKIGKIDIKSMKRNQKY